jgi:hypothetical protein
VRAIISVLPVQCPQKIDKHASRVKYSWLKTLNGKQTLFKDTTALETLTCDDALSHFIVYLETSIDNLRRETTKDICTILSTTLSDFKSQFFGPELVW